MENNMPGVYIIILNYKKWEEVVECLESVFRSAYANYSVIVIDNFSQNRSLEYLMRWAENGSNPNSSLSSSRQNIKPIPYKYFHSDELSGGMQASMFARLNFVQNDTNKGFAGGINVVLKKLLNEDAYIWLLNPDMVVEETALSGLVIFAEKISPRSIIGSVIKYYNAPQKVHLYAGGKINFNSATVEFIEKKSDIPELDYISGGSLFTSVRSFNEVGLFPENYFLYWEETDWCYRAKQAGYQLQVCETAVCYDKVSTTIGKSFLADYYYTRNGLLFLSKYKKTKVAMALFFVTLRFIKRIVTGQWKRAWGVYKGMLAFLKNDRHEHK
ncbi:MAG: glycosyltransferase family 2 protein [Chitinophagaceae bacterium]|nr:glycosyltransferase family 2 protein [Chitinophagaceae bacterium]